MAYLPLWSLWADRRPALIALRIVDFAMPVALAALVSVCTYIRVTRVCRGKVSEMLSRNR